MCLSLSLLALQKATGFADMRISKTTLLLLSFSCRLNNFCVHLFSLSNALSFQLRREQLHKYLPYANKRPAFLCSDKNSSKHGLDKYICSIKYILLVLCRTATYGIFFFSRKGKVELFQSRRMGRILGFRRGSSRLRDSM